MNQFAIKGRYPRQKKGTERGEEKQGREKNTKEGDLRGQRHLRGKTHSKRVVST